MPLYLLLLETPCDPLARSGELLHRPYLSQNHHPLPLSSPNTQPYPANPVALKEDLNLSSDVKTQVRQMLIQSYEI